MTYPKKMMMRAAAGVIGIIMVLLAAYFWYFEEQGNFHAITPGEAYRSAQLDHDELQHYVREHHIRSIINLRGKRLNKSWYREEIAASRKMGVRHYDFRGIGAVRPPSAEELTQLLALFASVPRPVLLHCQAGADRSGLAAALWKAVIDKAPASEARKQLSLRYGHMPVGPTQVLDRFFNTWISARSDSWRSPTSTDRHVE